MARSAGTLAALTAIHHEALQTIADQIGDFIGEGPDEWDHDLAVAHAATYASIIEAQERLDQLRQLLERPPTDA